MKKVLTAFLLSACCLASAADLFVFSADGVEIGSKPRELPAQGFNRYTHQVVVGLHARTDEERAACGWWRIVETPKPGIVVSNEYWTVTGYTFTNSVAYQAWGKKWRKVTPRRFSKMLIVAALTREGVWPQVKSWLEANDLWDAFMIANDFRDDDPNFKLGVSELKNVVGWTDKQIAALLAQCLAD